MDSPSPHQSPYLPAFLSEDLIQEHSHRLALDRLASGLDFTPALSLSRLGRPMGGSYQPRDRSSTYTHRPSRRLRSRSRLAQTVYPAAPCLKKRPDRPSWRCRRSQRLSSNRLATSVACTSKFGRNRSCWDHSFHQRPQQAKQLILTNNNTLCSRTGQIVHSLELQLIVTAHSSRHRLAFYINDTNIQCSRAALIGPCPQTTLLSYITKEGEQTGAASKDLS